MEGSGVHAHCSACVSRRCKTRAAPGIACELLACPASCGAVFHACKSQEHRLLCPQVPCNSNDISCESVRAAEGSAEHSQCYPFYLSCEPLYLSRRRVGENQRRPHETQGATTSGDSTEQLDMALAQRDQRMLLESLKVASGSSSATPSLFLPPSASVSVSLSDGEAGPAGGTLEKLYRASVETTRSLAKAYSILERATREMERMGHAAEQPAADEAQAIAGPSGLTPLSLAGKVPPAAGTASGIPAARDLVGLESNGAVGAAVNGGSDGINGEGASSRRSRRGVPVVGGGDGGEGGGAPAVVPARREGAEEAPAAAAAAASARAAPDRRDCAVPRSRAPLSVARSEESLSSCDSYVDAVDAVDAVDGAGAANAAGDTFLVYRWKRRMQDKSVDTGDLARERRGGDDGGVGEVGPGIDLVTAALLFCLDGESPCGRGVSDRRVSPDGARTDTGTQTFSLPSAVLATRTMVGEMASAPACDHASPQLSNPSPFPRLGLDLVLECVTRYQAKPRSMFTFVCGQLFRRDEFPHHFKNVHGDIHAGLNGWLEQRCPLAHYGCPYTQQRLCPSAPGAKVVHSTRLGSFGVLPFVPPEHRDYGRSAAPGERDRLSRLPLEVLQQVARRLDGYSLCQLSLVSRLLRDVCSGVLPEKGMVTLVWERGAHGEGGGPFWDVKKKAWCFSTAFSPVSRWAFAEAPSMEHLRRCRYNAVERRHDAVPLPCMCGPRQRTREGRSLRSVLRPAN
uniref:F-box protein 30 n=1 Tax=Petromyzon marinus TaxID=7757 RepID=S4R7G7_PETMA